MSIINDLSHDDITKGHLPLPDLLRNSLFYPSGGFDGGVVKFLSSDIQSFIYCDYATGEEALAENENSFWVILYLHHAASVKKN